MTRPEIIRELHKFFQVRELVCSHTFSRWGERSWQFLDTEYLHNLLVIRRDILQLPMTCNHDKAGQRGLRCNMCELVKDQKKAYLSSHVLGKAGDFTVTGLTAEEARRRIKENERLLPYPLRLEADVTWLHFDTLPQYDVNAKVYEFKG